MPAPLVNVALLLTPGASMSAVSAVVDLLDAAQTLAAPNDPAWQLRRVSPDGQAVPLKGGFLLAADLPLSALETADVLIIPSFMFNLRECLPEFKALGPQLRRLRDGGCTLVSICTGAFVLAECGLLDGLAATTHWALADAFRRRYPAVRLDTQAIVCDEGRVITSGGGMSALDVITHLLRRFGNEALAQRCSRYLVLDGSRGAQAAYAQWMPDFQHGDERVQAVQHWLGSALGGPVSIEDMAARAGLGERQTARRFKEATGMTPLAYLQALRLARARHLLETTLMRWEQVTAEAGYEDPASFRRLFQREVGLSPSNYRRQFAWRVQGQTGRAARGVHRA